MSIKFFTPHSNSGPGVLIFPGLESLNEGTLDWCQRLVEDGYTVGAVTSTTANAETVHDALSDLSRMPATGDNIAAIGFGAGADLILNSQIDFDAIILFDPITDQKPRHLTGPVIIHLSGVQTHPLTTSIANMPKGRVHTYDHCKVGFTDKGHCNYDKWAARIAYSRTLAPLRQAMGPHYDLAGLFADHLRLEFIEKDAHATMETMVDEPYVNHIPTRTGGVGHELLKRFYKYHFIPTQPEDRENTLISETVGADTVVLEILARFTHDRIMDHMIPGIQPSGNKVELPVVVIASFRGDKLYNEHIYWDQASLLTQVGALDPGDLPISGGIAAQKLENVSLPSNELMSNWHESEGKPL